MKSGNLGRDEKHKGTTLLQKHGRKEKDTKTTLHLCIHVYATGAG